MVLILWPISQELNKKQSVELYSLDLHSLCDGQNNKVINVTLNLKKKKFK